MTDTIATRVGRIVSGSVNSLIDAVESMAPELVMAEAINEVDAVIDEVRAELGRVIAQKHFATTRLAEENRKHAELSGKIETALEQGREDLAETAVAQLVDIEDQVPVLETTLTQAAEKETELEGYVSALQARKREMQVELKELRAAKSEPATADGSAAISPAAAKSGGPQAKLERAESAFERALEKAGGIALGARAPGREDAAKLAELDAMAREKRVKDRLAQFRKSV